jgi:hypothetical protein
VHNCIFLTCRYLQTKKNDQAGIKFFRWVPLLISYPINFFESLIKRVMNELE